MTLLAVSRAAVLASAIGLTLLIPLWYGILAPTQRVPPALPIALLVTPLVIALPSLLRARPYTHAWVSLLSLLYLAHGIVEVWANAEARMLASLEIVLSCTLYAGSIAFVRACKRKSAAAPVVGRRPSANS